MLSNYKYIILLAFIMSNIVISNVFAKAEVKGDPTLIWMSPLGDDNIENNAYNRCRIIRKLKPGVGKAAETTRNTYEILSTYMSDLYAQAIKISAYIGEEESESETSNSSSTDLTNEIALIEEGIVKNLADISRRMNIINSFEAGILVLDSMVELKDMSASVYEEFRAFDGQKYDYFSECEVLNK